jgi:hypothetical protein
MRWWRRRSARFWCVATIARISFWEVHVGACRACPISLLVDDQRRTILLWLRLSFIFLRSSPVLSERRLKFFYSSIQREAQREEHEAQAQRKIQTSHLHMNGISHKRGSIEPLHSRRRRVRVFVANSGIAFGRVGLFVHEDDDRFAALAIVLDDSN